MDSVYVVIYNYEYEGSYILGVYSTFEEAVKNHADSGNPVIELKTGVNNTLAFEEWLPNNDSITIEKWKVG